MPYSETSELPPAVQELTPKKQRQWMEVWNSVYADTKDEERAFRAAWSAVGKDKKAIDSEFRKYFSWEEEREDTMKTETQINDGKANFFAPMLKYDEKENMAYGYFSTEALDSQGQIVEAAAIEKAISGYMQWGNIREMHQTLAAGVAKSIKKDDKGWYLSCKVVDPIAQTKCREGVYKGFSIGGLVKTVVEDKMAKGGRITDLELHEISLVDRPANPECRIDIYKIDGAPKKEVTAPEAKKVSMPKLKKEAREKLVAKMAEMKKSFKSEVYGIQEALYVMTCIAGLMDGECWEMEQGDDERGQINRLSAAFALMMEFVRGEFAEQMASMAPEPAASSQDGTAMPQAQAPKAKMENNPEVASITEPVNDAHLALAEETKAKEAAILKAQEEAKAAETAKAEELAKAEALKAETAKAEEAKKAQETADLAKAEEAKKTAEAEALAKVDADKKAEDLQKLAKAEELLKAKETELAKANDEVVALKAKLEKLADEPTKGGPALRVVEKVVGGGEVSVEDEVAKLQKSFDAEQNPVAKRALGEKLALAETKQIFASGPQAMKR